jgi:predicted GNAT family N-acyltransferase
MKSVTKIQVVENDTLKGKALEIRRKVFIDELGVLPEDEYDRYDALCRHYLAFNNDEPVGTARWRESSDGIKLERFAVLPEYRGQGIGKKLLKAILKDLSGRKDKIYLHAQLPVVSFYKNAGFKEEGSTFREAGIDHVSMFYKRK